MSHDSSTPATDDDVRAALADLEALKGTLAQTVVGQGAAV